MPTRISTILNVTSKKLNEKGVFDGFIDIDSRLHIDPSLLFNCRIKEFQNAHRDFEQYYSNVLKLVINSKTRGDKFWNEALKRLQFKEMANTALGYSTSGVGGNAIGKELASNILETVSQISQAGINDPVIFELIGVIEDNVGADRISDMTMVILIDNFAQYTERLAKELKLQTKHYVFGVTSYQLPYDPATSKEIIFVPKALLNNLPVAYDWSDVDKVCKYNAELRAKINQIIGDSWKAATKIHKRELKKILLEEPELLRDLISQYKSKPKSSYDFTNDPIGEIIWAELSEKAQTEFPLDLKHFNPVTSENIFQVVKEICSHFASLIEYNGWFEYLYDNNGKQKPERAPQLLFFGIADVYCKMNNLDLNREVNSGIGSLDFKISSGYNAKVNVEIKYSTNTNLKKGFEKQLPAYNKAEKARKSIYLIIQTKENSKNIDEIYRIADKARLDGEEVPDIVVVNGQRQLSASKR